MTGSRERVRMCQQDWPGTSGGQEADKKITNQVIKIKGGKQNEFFHMDK